MLLTFYNTTDDSVRLCFGSTSLIIEPYQNTTVTIYGTPVYFALSPNRASQYSAIKTPDLVVLSEYELANDRESVSFSIVKQETTNRSKKYTRFIVLEEPQGLRVRYSIADKEFVKDQDKKNDALSRLLRVVSEFFSWVNVLFIALGVVVGKAFGIPIGIIAYLIVFGLYALVIVVIDWYQDRNMAIENFMTDEHIRAVFMHGKQG